MKGVGDLRIYTDGSYSFMGSTSGRGGWAYIQVVEGEIVKEGRGSIWNRKEWCGCKSKDRVDRMELMAVTQALVETVCNTTSEVHIYSDSKYVRGGHTLGRAYYMNKTCPDPNRDLWLLLFRLKKRVRSFQIRKVRRRSDEYTCRVDDLAKSGLRQRWYCNTNTERRCSDV